MNGEVVPIRRWRSEVPQEHRATLDTRLQWMWNQRFGTVQTIYTSSPDLLDKTAATLILQAIMARDLAAIRQLFQRLEGGAVYDGEEAEGEESVRI